MCVCVLVFLFFFFRGGEGIELSPREGIFFETEKQRMRRLLGAY